MCAWFVLKCSFLEISSTSHDKNYSKTFSNISSTAPLRKRILKSRPQNYANEPHVVAVAHLLRAACDTTDTVTFQSTRLPVPVRWRIVQRAEILVMSKLLQILSFICCSFVKFPFFPLIFDVSCNWFKWFKCDSSSSFLSPLVPSVSKIIDSLGKI